MRRHKSGVIVVVLTKFGQSPPHLFICISPAGTERSCLAKDKSAQLIILEEDYGCCDYTADIRGEE